MKIENDFGTITGCFYDDEERQAALPHGFSLVWCEFYIPSLTLRPYNWGREVCAVDDFGTLHPVYSPAIINLKQEGH